MPPLEFRAWDFDRKQWIEDADMDFGGGLVKNESQTWKGNYEVSQYTGCNDSSGTKIFSGDIYQETEIKGEVTFTAGSFYIGHTPIPDFVEDIGEDENIPIYSLPGKVIGNIYQNKDLLTK